MALNVAHARELLRNFDFRTLFIDELGWDRHTSALEVTIPGSSVMLSAVAQKRGMVAYHCPPIQQRIPDYAQRRKIDRQVSKTVHEHLIIFTDSADTTQIWQWVKREAGKPAACREHTFSSSQPGDSLLQKLAEIAVSLDEEAALSLPDVTRRARAAFDVERVTRRFYEEFQRQHSAFLGFISGIPKGGDREWYASVMLNRLMFIYFMQRKGFLDSDRDYLRNRLVRCRGERGQDKFYSFYRYFLLRLFHEGLGGRERSADLENLVGRVPYLNGGIFDVHELEHPDRYGGGIQIPDQAFEQIFDYFDRYQWHLDERPLRADNEINPDVLGYIFEKYINQKQMGAYYTKEDITGYISRNTVLPFLLDAARSKCRIAFENPGGPTVWDLLRDDPDRYIYPALRHGISWDVHANGGKGARLEEPRVLPPDIADGIDTGKPRLIERRSSWNKPASAEHALPTEIWREVVARRQRCDELRRKLAAGEVHEINDLITLNLDIHQFAQDAIETCEGPELLRAFWRAIEKITILDPTCGSGAFLFAALNVLEPLYQACLDQMERFVEDLNRSGEKHRPERFSDFRKVLARVAAHPNRRYFILKNIILNNLFGVDIMEEAVEICKLRLFLKLAAQVEPDASIQNFGIEPLPDIDFNIRTGNSLVGYATYEEVQEIIASELDLKSAMEKIALRAADSQDNFDAFRRCQTEGDGSVPPERKLELRQRIRSLQEELNLHVADQYDVKVSDKTAYASWLKAYLPFHWFVEFYGIISRGGFDVIIGNPPYLERREVNYEPKNFESLSTGTVHALCVERSSRLSGDTGCLSMIVPLSLPSTQRMQVVQRLLEHGRNVWFANYAWRPAKLFDTVNRALTIFVAVPAAQGRSYSTAYQKWTSSDRNGLFDRLKYVEVRRQRPAFWVPKLCEPIEQSILTKCLAMKTRAQHFMRPSDQRIFYRTTGGLYWKVFTDFPPAFRLNGKPGTSSRETSFSLASRSQIKQLIGALSSNLFWWWYTISSNLRDLNPSDIQGFPLPESALNDAELQTLGDRYLKDIARNSTMLVREQRQTGRAETQSFKIQRSKPIIDEIDRVLAVHYRFCEEELDYIINYDIKYRMGGSTDNDNG